MLMILLYKVMVSGKKVEANSISTFSAHVRVFLFEDWIFLKISKFLKTCSIENFFIDIISQTLAGIDQRANSIECMILSLP